MLNPNPAVAAPAALNKVDEPFSKTALALVLDKDMRQVEWARANPNLAQPLVPLLFAHAMGVGK